MNPVEWLIYAAACEAWMRSPWVSPWGHVRNGSAIMFACAHVVEGYSRRVRFLEAQSEILECYANTFFNLATDGD